ncbi:carboxypeptidase-like regulatory domain-containing protein [Spirosoma spitsbergense]|uniref:carboxypeptidase-like regulatory domain-containing protein n=1 Tax=Spirosoma spitsbergense TaxID=431554 RepID=UPI00036BFB19|nr:carboxypeptidase-like regulatory domain-containing protein [Spirosoma spitsbergense]
MNTNPGVIAGKVRTADGQPVAMARVYFTSGPVALPDITMLTDATGSFSLSAPVAGTYQIGCTADGFAPAMASVEVKNGQKAQVELVLKP